MSNLMKSIMKILGVVFGALVVGFTGFQTWSLLYEVSANQIVATLGLILFEGGMLYWWLVFLNDADGLGQMSVSLLSAIFGLVLVTGATGLHLGAIGADTLGASTPAKLITVAAIVNLVAKFIMPLVAPDVLQTIYRRAMEGLIMAQAYKVFQSKTNEIAAGLADDMADQWVADMSTLLNTRHIRRGLPEASRAASVGEEGSRPEVVAIPAPEAQGVVALGESEATRVSQNGSRPQSERYQ